VDVESEHVAGHGLDDVCGDVDTLIEDIQKEWCDHEAKSATQPRNNVGSPGAEEATTKAASAVAGDVQTVQQSQGAAIVFPTSVPSSS